MNANKKLLITFSLILFSIALVSAQQFSIDISGLNAEKYNPSENITFKIILLEDGKEIQKQVTYTLNDALNKKEVTGQTNSNEETSLKIENNFPSGLWTIKAKYQDSEVSRGFNIKENQKVELLIEGDTLIIRNKGNTRYTKTIQITIGSETNSYSQNIKAGTEKKLKLISKDGTYNIEVTDGETTIKREAVQLFGVGNVVGAIDEELVGYTGFAGVENVNDPSNKTASLKKLPLAMIFVAAVGILAALIIVERKMAKRKKNS